MNHAIPTPKPVFDLDQLDELDRVTRELRALAVLLAATEFDETGGLSSLLDRLGDAIETVSDTATRARAAAREPAHSAIAARAEVRGSVYLLDVQPQVDGRWRWVTSRDGRPLRFSSGHTDYAETLAAGAAEWARLVGSAQESA